MAVAAAATSTIQELTSRYQAALANEAVAWWERDAAVAELRQVTTGEQQQLRPVALRAMHRSAIGIGARSRRKGRKVA